MEAKQGVPVTAIAVPVGVQFTVDMETTSHSYQIAQKSNNRIVTRNTLTSVPTRASVPTCANSACPIKY